MNRLSGCFSEARNNDAPRPVPTFGFPTKVTNATGHVIYTQFDFGPGRPVNRGDVTGIMTNVPAKELAATLGGIGLARSSDGTSSE